MQGSASPMLMLPTHITKLPTGKEKGHITRLPTSFSLPLSPSLSLSPHN